MMKLWHVPLRLATGAFFLNSGLSKRGIRGEGAEQLQGFASTAVPQAQAVEPERFASALSNSEIALGAALLTPLVPSWLAGVGLTAFGAGLNRLYLKAPGLRQEGDLRPTEQGIGIAKDVWLTAIGLALITDRLTDGGD